MRGNNLTVFIHFIDRGEVHWLIFCFKNVPVALRVKIVQKKRRISIIKEIFVFLCNRDKRVRVWEWQKGLGYVEATFSPLMGHKYGVTSVKVSPQCTMLASASIDGTTHLWNLRVGFLAF